MMKHRTVEWIVPCPSVGDNNQFRRELQHTEDVKMALMITNNDCRLLKSLSYPIVNSKANAGKQTQAIFRHAPDETVIVKAFPLRYSPEMEVQPCIRQSPTIHKHQKKQHVAYRIGQTLQREGERAGDECRWCQG